MTDLPFRYDDVPYNSFSYRASAPDRLCTMAKLFGMHAAMPDNCRVLEIGSAAGGNLVPLALRYPGSTFLGMDLSAVEIEHGQQLAAPLGLHNLELRQANVLDIDASWGTFDYIIVHGVWSWVPEEVRDHIFRVCSQNLAPKGVAYISYNTLPGWHMRGMIRDMMLYHAQGFEGWKRKVEQARGMLSFLANAHGDAANGAYANHLRAEAALLDLQPDDYLYHDHLSDLNHPVYFHQFIEQADKHGLTYLGESDLNAMLPVGLPERVQATLHQIAPDVLRMEQYLDFIRNRTFRATLLVHNDVDLKRNLDWRDVATLHLGTSGTLECSEEALRDNSEVTVVINERSVGTDEPLIKAAFRLLIDRWPQTVPFEDLLREARALCASEAEEQDDRERLGGNMLRCLANLLIEARPLPVAAVPLSERPEAFPWARMQIAAGVRRISNLRHDSPWVPEFTARLLWYCDGTRDRAQLIEALVASARDAELVPDPDAAALGPDDRRALVTQKTDELLASLERNSFFIA